MLQQANIAVILAFNVGSKYKIEVCELCHSVRGPAGVTALKRNFAGGATVHSRLLCVIPDGGSVFVEALKALKTYFLRQLLIMSDVVLLYMNSK